MLDHLLELCVFCFTFLSFNVAHVSLFFFPAGFVSARLPPSRERLLERTERRLLPHKGLRSLSHSDRAPLMSLVLIVMNIQRGGVVSIIFMVLVEVIGHKQEVNTSSIWETSATS